jgi:hypothetical protein
MESASEQLGLVIELVTLSRPLDDVLRDLTIHHRDLDSELIQLERTHIEAVLRRYLAGELDEAAVEAWANAVDLRDDVGVPDDDTLLKNILFDLANPRESFLTAQRAEQLLATLCTK